MWPWTRVWRFANALGLLSALCLANGVVSGQTTKPPPGPVKATPTPGNLSVMPDLVVTKFHFSKVLCVVPDTQKPGYRGWFEGKNQGLAPATPSGSPKLVGIYFKGQLITYSIFMSDTPIASGAGWASDLYIPQPDGPAPYNMVARVDPDQSIAELQENNNDFPFQIAQDARRNCRASQPVPGGPKLPSPNP